MIRSSILFAALLAILALPALAGDDAIAANDVLQKISAKLSSLKAVRYKYKHEYNYKSEAYLSELNSDAFLDFDDPSSATGVRFQFDSQHTFVAFNGSELFSINKKQKTIQVIDKPKTEQLDAQSHLQFSLPMWRNALPQIIADKRISKTIQETKVDNKACYLIELSIDKASIDSGLGLKISPISLNRKSIYRLTIDKESLLPILIYRGTNVNDDFNKVTITEINENPALPAERSWYYSTFLSDYKYAKPSASSLIKIGEAAHDINLLSFDGDKTTTLADYKGNIVLLEFWIFHCGYCQLAVPKLNFLHDKYKNKGLKILAVNISDSPKHLRIFTDKFKPEFQLFHQGEAAAKQYGVGFYPTIVLLGKDGRVVYSGELNESKIMGLIDQNM